MGSLVFHSGVGTQMSTASILPSFDISVVARSRPAFTQAATSARSAQPAQSSLPSQKEKLPADGRHQRSSPLVRRIASEHGVDLAELSGTGISGRVTKHDILAHLGLSEVGEPAKASGPAAPPAAAPPKFKPGQSVEIVPMSVMRRKIAEHMITSRRTSAHVHSVFEVNFSRVAQLREAKKGEYEREGTKLTFLSYIARAVVLSRSISDLAARARAKRLSPDDVQGGTFTITNPGVFGALFGMPIINQPQVAILGVGAVEKRPVVVGDAIAIRHMAYLMRLRSARCVISRSATIIGS